MTTDESMRLAQALIARYNVTEDNEHGYRLPIGAGELSIFFQCRLEEIRVSPDLIGSCTCANDGSCPCNGGGSCIHDVQDIDDDGHCKTCDRLVGGCHCPVRPTDIDPDEEETRAVAQSIHDGHCGICDRAASHCKCKDTTFTPEEDH